MTELLALSLHRLDQLVEIAGRPGVVAYMRQTPRGARYGVVLDGGAWLEVGDGAFDQLTLDL